MARFIVGDSLTVLRTLPTASVDLVVTSPPFLGLRSYLAEGDPNKGSEMGSEAGPGEFIDALLDITEECRRVLAPHGSICIELGDTYSGSGGAGGDYGPAGLRAGQPAFGGSASLQRTPGGDERGSRRLGAAPYGPRQITDGWPSAKSLCLIPELFRIALVYGRNPLTGRETPTWRARNVIRWCRPNPPVGALGDKVRPATSDLVVACVSTRRYFDLDAIRQVGVEPGAIKRKTKNHSGANPRSGWETDNADIKQNPAGAPPNDHWWADDDRFDQDAWNIPTAPYKGSHYATFPERLVIRPILAMCPTRVCTTCGLPSERITETTQASTGRTTNGSKPRNRAESFAGTTYATRTEAVVHTLGWSDCGHDTWRAGVVLDPFAGSGTTLAVAVGAGRDAIGIDLDARNAHLAAERCGMFLTVEDAA